MPRTYRGRPRRPLHGRRKKTPAPPGPAVAESAPARPSAQIAVAGPRERETGETPASPIRRGPTLEGVDYRYVIEDLRRIGLVSGVLFGGLVLLAFLLR